METVEKRAEFEVAQGAGIETGAVVAEERDLEMRVWREGEVEERAREDVEKGAW